MLFNLGGPLLSRITTVLALKVLPDEAALNSYIRNLLKGVSFLIIGSVLLGATISAGLFVAYDQLVANGYSKTNVLAVTMGSAFILVLLCFYLANQWLTEKLGPKPRAKSIIDQKLDHVKDIASDSLAGFIEGFLDNSRAPKKRYDNTVDIRTAKKRK